LPTTKVSWDDLYIEAGKVFTPASPVSEESLFAGRIEQLHRVIDAVNQRGQHAIVFGERGVGKTSLSFIISTKLSRPGADLLTPRINCDSTDTYTTIWRKVFSEIDLIRERPAIGFQMSIFQESSKAADVLPDPCGPDDVRRLLTILSDSATVIVVLDEFDRITDEKVRRAMADTIKVLSDNSVPATLVLVGVADSVDALIVEHQSIERALVQIVMPRMSQPELRQIIEKGLSRLGMEPDHEAAHAIAVLSQGLPHYTHLIGLHACRAAIDGRQRNVTVDQVDFAIRKSVESAQHSLKSAYLQATASHQADNIYSYVLLACALTRTDPLGYFIATAVKKPLSLITGRSYDVPGFNKHLKQFCELHRGCVLSGKGPARKIKYRFANPLMQPYIVMQGLIDKRIDRATVERETFFNQPNVS
jgi:Cdc6-like AAA superfamily ATPase